MPIRRTVGLVMTFCLLPTLAPACLPAQREPDTGSWREVSGDGIPEYVVVEAFLRKAAENLKKDDGSYQRFAADFGFHEEPGQCCPIEIMTNATRTFMEMKDLDVAKEPPLNDPAEFKAWQNQRTRRKAQELGEVYGRILAELKALGIPTEVFGKTIDRLTRSHLTIFTDDDPESVVFDCDEEFRLGVERSLGSIYNAPGSSNDEQ